MKLDAIIPGALYQRAHFEQFPLDKKLAALEDKNIGMVVCCWKREDPELRPYVTYVHFPFADGFRESQLPKIEKHLNRIAERCAYEIRQGKAVLVHCQGGRNRSGLLSALIVRQVEGVSGVDAVRRVKAGRPNALANETFVSYLEKLPPL